MLTAHPLAKAIALLGAAWTALAVAQPVTIERPEFDLRLSYPAGWFAESAPAGGDAVALTFTAPGDAGLVVVVLDPISATERAGLEDLGTDGVWDAWAGFAEDVPGAQAERVGVRTVAGVEAGVVDYVGQGIAGSLISVVGTATAYTVVSIGYDGSVAEVQDGLETILASFTFLSAAGVGGAGNPLAAGAGGADNPLAAPASGNPLGAAPAAASGNPLAGPPAASSGNPLAAPPAASSGNPLAAAPSNPLAPVSPAGYEERFTGTDPASVFGGALDIGSDGTWTGALTGASYRLTNAAAPDALRYYFRMSLPGETGPLAQGTTSVTVRVDAGDGPLAAAGLLFDFDPADGSYLAFALTATGYVALQRGAGGVEVLAMEDLDSIRPGAPNRLTLRGFGNTVEVMVNDQRAATLNAERAFDGGVGIVAVGTGAFEFQGFRYLRP